MLRMYFQKTKCLFAIGIMLPGHSKFILAEAMPLGLQLCSIGRRSASRSLLYEYAAWDLNWCPHECKSHWGHKLNLLFCYLLMYYYYYHYCVFLYSYVLGCLPGFKWPERESENSPQSNVKICSNFLLAFPHWWVNMNKTTVVPLQSGSPGDLTILGPNILQYFQLKLFWKYFIIIIINTTSVGTPRTRWEDIVQRDALHILGIQGWRRWAGIEKNGGTSWGRLGATRGCSALCGWIVIIIIITIIICCWVQYIRLKEFYISTEWWYLLHYWVSPRWSGFPGNLDHPLPLYSAADRGTAVCFCCEK